MIYSFSLERDALLTHLSAMQPICSKRSPLDVTESILFQVSYRELILKATDLEISLQSSLPIESSLSEVRSFLISGRRIYEIVRELSGMLEFSFIDAGIQLTAGEGVAFTLAVRDAQDFPAFPERIENLMHCESPFLLSLLDKVGIVVPQNNATKALNGMLLEAGPQGVAFVGTDGHSLAYVETAQYSLAEQTQWLIPRRALLEVKKLLEQTTDVVFIGTCAGQLVFSGTHFNFFTRLLNDPFPTYKPILSTNNFTQVQISRESLIKALRRAGALLAGQFIASQFSFSVHGCEISLENKDIGSLRQLISCEIPSEFILDTAFYSPYLLSGLLAITDDVVSCFVKDKRSALIVRSKQQNYEYTYVVMPVSREGR
ncbi:DNA polymerase III subunit beta [Candidatus Dependentiae bacterium]|nr:DNA polymerase III subunit beta [Candidatus Dependentiae bacterium]